MREYFILPLLTITINPTFCFLQLWRTTAFEPKAYTYRAFRRKQTKLPDVFLFNTEKQMEHTNLSNNQSTHA